MTEDRKRGWLLFTNKSDLNERCMQKRISITLHLIYTKTLAAETASLSPADYGLSLLKTGKAAKGMGNNNIVIRLTFTIGVGYHIQFLPAHP